MKKFTDSVKEMSKEIKLLVPTVKKSPFRLFESFNKIINNKLKA